MSLAIVRAQCLINALTCKVGTSLVSWERKTSLRQPLPLVLAVLISLAQAQTLATSSVPQKQTSVPDISQIDYEFSASAILCDRHRIILNQDGSSALFTELCRNRAPGDPATYCQVKRDRKSVV